MGASFSFCAAALPAAVWYMTVDRGMSNAHSVLGKNVAQNPAGNDTRMCGRVSKWVLRVMVRTLSLVTLCQGQYTIITTKNVYFSKLSF